MPAYTIRAKRLRVDQPDTLVSRTSSTSTPSAATVPSTEYHISMLPDNKRFNNIRYAYPGYNYDASVLRLPGAKSMRQQKHRETTAVRTKEDRPEEENEQRMRERVFGFLKVMAVMFFVGWMLWKVVRSMTCVRLNRKRQPGQAEA